MVELPINTEGNALKKEKPEPYKKFLTIAGLCLQRTVDCAAKVGKRFGVKRSFTCLSHRNT